MVPDIGTTHHEAGTLWMGKDQSDSVTNLDGRYHISNAYVAGPALFPTLGSANPSLTALTLARRTAHAIVTQSLPVEAGFAPLGNGGLDGWQMAGFGGFMELGGNLIETINGIGLLWYTRYHLQVTAAAVALGESIRALAMPPLAVAWVMRDRRLPV